MGNDERKAIFAKNFSYLCAHLCGGEWFLAEKLTGITRPTYWEQGRKVSEEELLELTTTQKRLNRWRSEGVVRFDRRTRQDFMVLKEVFGLQSIEDFWQENLVDDLEARRTQEKLAAQKKGWASTQSENNELHEKLDNLLARDRTSVVKMLDILAAHYPDGQTSCIVHRPPHWKWDMLRRLLCLNCMEDDFDRIVSGLERIAMRHQWQQLIAKLDELLEPPRTNPSSTMPKPLDR